MELRLGKIKSIAVLFGICGVLFAPASAFSANSVKQSIFDNCEAAMSSFDKLNPQEEAETIEYVIRILALNTEVPSVAEAYVLPSGGIGADGAPPALWQAVDAKRELAAKRCALQLLDRSGHKALSFLPSLVALYSQESVSDELAVKIEEVSANIAESAHLKELSLSESALNEIGKFLSGPRPLVAQNVLSEFSDQGLKESLKQLSELSGEEAVGIVKFIREIDPTLKHSYELLFDMARTLEHPRLERLVAALPPPAKEIVPELTKKAASLAADTDPLIGKIFIKVLGKVCLVTDGLDITPSAAAQISARPNEIIFSTDAVPPDELKCLLAAIPGFGHPLVEQFLSTDLKVSQSALKLIPSAINGMNSHERDTLYGHLKNRAFNRDELSAEVIPILAEFSSRGEETSKLYLELLKEQRKVEISPPLFDRRSSVLKGLVNLNAGLVTKYFLPQLLDWLSSGYELNNVEMILIRIGPAIEPKLLDLWKSGSIEVRQRVIRFFMKFNPSPRALKVLAGALNVNELKSLIDALLTAQCERTPNPVLEIRKELTAENRVATLSRLVKYKVATRKEANELAVSQSKLRCEALEQQTPVLQALLQSAQIDTMPKSSMISKLASCLPTGSSVSARAWVKLLPIASLKPDIILRSNIPTDPQFIDAFSELTAKIEAATVTSWLPVFQKALGSDVKAIKARVLEVLIKPSVPLPGEMLPTLRQIASSRDSERNLYLLASEVLANQHDAQYDWKPFLKDLIDRAGNGEKNPPGLELLRLIPAKTVIDVALPGLASDNAVQAVGAARISAAVGKEALPLVARLWELRKSKYSAVQYAAFLALLEINPLTPGLDDHLRKILVNRYFQTALHRNIDWSDTVAVSEVNSEPLGGLRHRRLRELMVSK